MKESINKIDFNRLEYTAVGRNKSSIFVEDRRYKKKIYKAILPHEVGKQMCGCNPVAASEHVPKQASAGATLANLKRYCTQTML